MQNKNPSVLGDFEGKKKMLVLKNNSQKFQSIESAM